MSFTPSDLVIVSKEDVEGELVLSASKMYKYLKCPYLYYKHYSTPKKKRFIYSTTTSRVPSSVMFGAIFHQTLEKINKQAKNDGKFPGLESAIDVFNSSWRPMSRFYATHIRAIFFDRAKSYLSNYYSLVVQHITPRVVEHPFILRVCGIPICGSIDLVTDKGDLLDFKTSYKLPGKFRYSSLQLRLYSLAYLALFETLPRTARYLYFTEKPTRGLHALPPPSHSGKVKWEHLDLTVKLVKHVHRMLNEENYTPVQGAYCGRCPYRARCPAF